MPSLFIFAYTGTMNEHKDFFFLHCNIVVVDGKFLMPNFLTIFDIAELLFI